MQSSTDKTAHDVSKAPRREELSSLLYVSSTDDVQVQEGRPRLRDYQTLVIK